MAATLKELETKLAALSDQLQKASTEITTEIQNLKDALANTVISDAAQASLDKLTTLVQALDDLNPDT